MTSRQQASTTEKNKALVRCFYEELDNQNWQQIAGLFTSDYTAHVAGSPGPLNGEAHIQFGRMFSEAFPDLRHTIEDQIAEGEKVVTQLTVRGTHKGNFQGIPPTQKQITVAAITIHRLSGSRIAEAWGQFDAMGLMQQLGAIPA